MIPDDIASLLKQKANWENSVTAGDLRYGECFSQGALHGDAQFLDKLWDVLIRLGARHRQLNMCELCDAPHEIVICAHHRGRRRILGRHESVVYLEDGRVLRVSDMILHNILVHKYLPEDAIVTAVREWDGEIDRDYVSRIAELGMEIDYEEIDPIEESFMAKSEWPGLPQPFRIKHDILPEPG